MTAPVQPALMYIRDVAAYLGKSPAQVYKMRERGQLPPPLKQAGLGLCWRRADIEKWVAQLKP